MMPVIEGATIRVEDFPESMLQERELPYNVTMSETWIEIMILEELNQCRMSGEKTGQKRLAESLRKRGIAITEAEIRTYLDRFEKSEDIQINRGRGGTQMTDKGMQKL